MIINGKKFADKVSVLGQDYSIFYVEKEKSNDPKFSGSDGYTEIETKEIFIEKELFDDSEKDSLTVKDLPRLGRRVIRHEIIHAFMEESGLNEGNGWVHNEECVDWIAKQFPKMLKAFREVGVVD